MENNVPIYVKIDDYKDITDLLSATREQLQTVHHILDELKGVKAEEDKMIEQWAHDITDVEESINEIDTKLSHG